MYICIFTKYKQQNNVLFISDEGQSCLNDPGYDLLSLTNDIKYDIDIIAGPSVITTAASYAAINNLGFSNFIFLVNIEQNKEKRIEYLNKIKGLSSNIIFTTVYPTYFNQSVLEDILNILGDKKIVLCMSLTMENQKIITLRINELIEKLNNDDSFMLDQNKFYSPVTIAILN